MKLTTKKVVISLVIVLVFVALWGWNKAKTLMAVFNQMTIDPAGISKVDVSLQSIKFNIDVLLTNPTAQDFNVSGYGLASLREISVFYDGIYLATAPVNLTEISVPADDKLIIHDIAVEVPKPLEFIANHLVLVGSLIQDFNNFDINKISCTGVIELAGQTIEI